MKDYTNDHNLNPDRRKNNTIKANNKISYFECGEISRLHYHSYSIEEIQTNVLLVFCMICKECKHASGFDGFKFGIRN
jgi:hypothetical protein